MKNRFIITEIYTDGLAAVNKVLVDTQTHVQYLMHQEGATMSMCVLLGADGLPLLADEIEPHPLLNEPRKPIVAEKDRIQKRPETEELVVLPPVEVNKEI